MLFYYLKVAVRNLRNQKFQTALNVFGLSLGIAGGIVLYRFISFHLSYDRYHKKSEQLYRVVTDIHFDDGFVSYDEGTPLGMAPELQKRSPQVGDGATLIRIHSMTVAVPPVAVAVPPLSVAAAASTTVAPIPATSGWKYFSEKENSAFTDAHWFHLFDYTWQEGDPATALEQPNQAVITRRLAEKYFGNQEALGRSIRVNDQFLIRIAGVLADLPGNTDLKTELFLSRVSFPTLYPADEKNLSQDWSFINSTTNSYVWLPKGDPAGNMDRVFEAIGKSHFNAGVVSAYHFHLQPMRDLHFDGRYTGTMRRSLLVTLGVVALFLVLIACFNFINLATARMAMRVREIGTRKVLGGSAANIFWQCMTESAGIALLATGFSFVWVRLSLGLMNEWLQIGLGVDLLRDGSLLLVLSLVLVGVIAVSGIYPALLLSRLRPADVLKKGGSGGPRAGFYRKGLIVLQNVVVQALVICTLLISLQIRHLKQAALGFSKSDLLMIPIPAPDKDKITFLGNELGHAPGIRSLSFCVQSPTSTMNRGGSIAYDNRPWEKFVGYWIMGDTNYIHTFGLKLLAGANLAASDSVKEYLVNETMMQKLGIHDPRQIVGHRLVGGAALGDFPGTIVGVVKDFNVHSLYTPQEPALITTQRILYQQMAVKLTGTNEAGTRDAIRKAWEAAYPGHAFEYHYLDGQIDEFYHKEDLLSRLINAAVAIAILISCLGLLGLISFFANQRAKEIGIRKVLGAGVPSIVYLLSRDFLKLVLLSMLVASPLAWWFMHHWLQEFAYRVTIGWWVFALAGFGSLFISILTVGYQACRAAWVNPVESLRRE